MLKQQHRKSIMELEKTLKEEEARREIEAKRQKIVEENEDEISTPKTDGIQKSPGVAQESLRSETENKPAVNVYLIFYYSCSKSKSYIEKQLTHPTFSLLC